MTNSRGAVLTAPRVGAQRPPKLHLPEGIASVELGRDCIEFAESVGLVLDDWQRWLVEITLAERADGSPAASTSVVIVPRQNGKGGYLEAIELFGLYCQHLPKQVHSAHLTDTAADHMARLKSLIEGDPELAGITTIYQANGKERIVNNETQGVIQFTTRTKGTKRGTSPQRIVLDEALFLTDEHLGAMVPALAAQSMNADRMPQVIVTSSAPLPDSTVLHRFRRQGMAGMMPRQFYAEWSCDLGVDPYDRAAWFAANPALGIRIAEEFIADTELATMRLEDFLVERLGVVTDEDGAASELPRWSTCVDPQSHRAGAATFALDVATDLSWTSVAVAGPRADGLAHVELVERLPGVAGAVPFVVALCRKHGAPIHLDPRSPAGGLIDGLRAEGVTVVEVSGLDAVKACASLRQAVEAGTLRHIGQGPLDLAVSGAAIRAAGDGWTWARRTSSVDISPLVAVTLAHAAVTHDGTDTAIAFVL